jgi:hypothetical protein
MAWLNATPKPDERSKAARPEFERPKISRIEQMKKDRIPVLMPPNPAPALVGRLMEIGLSEAAGTGAAPLSWREIDAWCNRTGVDLPPWEARLIRQLSVEYLAESRRAESVNCPPPWRGEVTRREREVELARLEMVLG